MSELDPMKFIGKMGEFTIINKLFYLEADKDIVYTQMILLKCEDYHKERWK